jgi:hypothetical protein
MATSRPDLKIEPSDGCSCGSTILDRYLRAQASQ